MAGSSSSSDGSRRGAGRLGLRAAQPRADAQRFASALEALWSATVGALYDVEADLQTLKRYFDPVATGSRLRRELASLAQAPPQAFELEPPVVLYLDATRRLVTPEGRVTLDLLRDALLRGDDPVLIGTADLVDAERRLLDLYRAWSRHRIGQVVSLQSGSDKPLQMPAIGLLLVLLVNRVDDPTRALTLPTDIEALRRIDLAFIEPADRFAKTLIPSLKHDSSKESLHRGWWLGEIARRIPTSIVARDDRLYITPQGRPLAIGLAARELASRPVDAAAIAVAFDELVAAYRERAAALAGFELAFERPNDTVRLRSELIDSYRAAVTRADATAGAA